MKIINPDSLFHQFLFYNIIRSLTYYLIDQRSLGSHTVGRNSSNNPIIYGNEYETIIYILIMLVNRTLSCLPRTYKETLIFQAIENGDGRDGETEEDDNNTEKILNEERSMP